MVDLGTNFIYDAIDKDLEEKVYDKVKADPDTIIQPGYEM